MKSREIFLIITIYLNGYISMKMSVFLSSGFLPVIFEINLLLIYLQKLVLLM